MIKDLKRYHTKLLYSEKAKGEELEQEVNKSREKTRDLKFKYYEFSKKFDIMRYYA